MATADRIAREIRASCRRMQRRAAIVGAGVTGLVAGRELARRGFAVTLYERWPDVGGQASAFDVGGGVLVERYYHHLFRSDREMIALHDELLPGTLEWHRSSVGMYSGGRIWPFVSPRDLLAYAPLPALEWRQHLSRPRSGPHTTRRRRAHSRLRRPGGVPQAAGRRVGGLRQRGTR